MSTLSETWDQLTQLPKTDKARKSFWQEFSDEEQRVYEILLKDARTSPPVLKGTVSEAAAYYGMDPVPFIGFLDGINTSLKQELQLDELEADTVLDAEVDIRELYKNMLDYKAKHLYTLPGWDDLLTPEERTAIRRDWLASKQKFAEHPNVGRNDPCPCGSGKKYKKCCWAKDHQGPQAS